MLAELVYKDRRNSFFLGLMRSVDAGNDADGQVNLHAHPPTIHLPYTYHMPTAAMRMARSTHMHTHHTYLPTYLHTYHTCIPYIYHIPTRAVVQK